MASNNLPKLPSGALLTVEEFNAVRVALSGDIVPRDTDGNVAPSGGRCGTPDHPFSEGNFESINVGNAAIRTRDDSVYWNGVLNTLTPAVVGVTGACTHLRIAPGGREVDILSGLKIAQGGTAHELTSNVRLPRPVGSDPEGGMFDIRRVGWRSNLFSYDSTFAHSEFTPRDDNGTDVHEYGVFYDVISETATVAPLAGVYVAPSGAPTTGIVDHDRIWVAGDNSIHRRAGSAWVPTREAFIGAISYESNGDIRSVFAVRSRQFYDIITRIPFADFVSWVASGKITWASTISSNEFGVSKSGATLATLKFTLPTTLSPAFKDSGTGGSLTSFRAAGNQTRVAGATAGDPAGLVAKNYSVIGARPTVTGIITSPGDAGFVPSTRETGSTEGKMSGLYWGDQLYGWGRDEDERALESFLEFPDPVLGMHPYLPARALVYAFVGLASGAGVGEAKISVSGTISLQNPILPDGTVSTATPGTLESANSYQAIGNTQASLFRVYFPMVRRPDLILRANNLQPLLLPATQSSDFGPGESRLKARFGINRDL